MSSRLRSPAHVGHATAAPVCVRSREARTAALAPASMSETVQPDRLRSFEFWRRAGTIYANYKVAQAQASWMHFRGHTKEYIEENHWIAHHDKAGRDMYGLCVDLRGFFIKVRFVQYCALLVPGRLPQRRATKTMCFTERFEAYSTRSGDVGGSSLLARIDLYSELTVTACCSTSVIIP